MDVSDHSDSNDDDAEQGSSEGTSEGVSNVSTKLFSEIDSYLLGKQRLIVGQDKSDHISAIVQLPDGQVAAVHQYMGIDKYLKILDRELETRLTLVDINSRFQNTDVPISKMKIALFDGKRVAASISCFVEIQERLQPLNIIHLISVLPNIEVGEEIKLKCKCEHITCFNNKIYCYSPDLHRSTIIACPGVEILSKKGKVLKTIQLFDHVSCFCPTHDGGIIYFGNRKVDGYTKNVYRCVTNDNVEAFSQTVTETPSAVIADIAGNIIVLNSSGNIVLLNPDGSQKRVLLNQNDMEVTDEDISSFGPRMKLTEEDISRHPTSLCFSDDYTKLLVACRLEANEYGDTRQKLYLYTFEYKD